MKFIVLLALMLTSFLIAEDLKLKSNFFSADEKAGISIFEGDVNVIKGIDELNATKVTIYTDAQHKPTKFIAQGNVSFFINTDEGSVYKGKAGEVIYFPLKKEYHFFKDVKLQQIDETKVIIGDEVVLKTIEGKAYAKGVKSEPVIMIFKMPEKGE